MHGKQRDQHVVRAATEKKEDALQAGNTRSYGVGCSLSPRAARGTGNGPREGDAES